MHAQLTFDAKALLGEGAIWNNIDKKLYWVDIEGRAFHVYDPSVRENRSYKLDKRVGTVVPAGFDRALLAIEDGIALITLSTGSIDYKIKTAIHHEGNRFNDGKCDPKGRFWVGSMSLSDIPERGVLYCVTEDFEMIEKLDKVSISNGIAWSLDGSVMYYIDTPTKKIVKYNYDLHTGHISDPETIVEVPDGMGYPDGMTIDKDGFLWVALWDGFGVAQYDPFDGRLLQKIEVPAPKVTSCAFGGEDLDTLFITTARVEMSNEELELYPLSGALFTAKVGTQGLHAHSFKGV